MNPPIGTGFMTVALILIGGIALVNGWITTRRMDKQRRWFSLGMRLIAFLCIVSIVLNPGKWDPLTKEEENTWAVMIDASKSMQIEDEDGTRWARAADITKQALEIAGEGKLGLYIFDSHIKTVAGPPEDGAEGETTDIYIAGQELLQMTQRSGNEGTVSALKGIILLSDGRQIEAAGNKEFGLQARAYNVPIYPIPLGQEVQQQDLKLTVRRKQYVAFANQDININYTLHNMGLGPVAPKVTVTDRDGADIGTQEFFLKNGEKAGGTIKLDTMRPGYYEYKITAPVWESEVDYSNNHAVFSLTVLDQRLKILFVEGIPSWESKFLVQMLRKLPSVDTRSVFRVTSDRFLAIESDKKGYLGKGETVFPDTIEELEKYDVLLFGKGIEFCLDEHRAKLLADYVAEKGGGVIFTRGKPNSSEFGEISRLEPVIWGDDMQYDLQFTPTDTGEALELFGGDLPDKDGEIWQNMPPMEQALTSVKLKSFAQVLSEGIPLGQGFERVPLMVCRRIGQGVVVTFNGDGVWRWDFRREDDEERRIYEQLWLRTVHWAATYSDFLPGRGLALQVTRNEIDPGSTIGVMVRRRSHEESPDGVICRLMQGVENVRTVELKWQDVNSEETRYILKITQPGDYTLEAYGAEAPANRIAVPIRVKPPLTETNNVSPDKELLNTIASESGGRIITPEDLPELLQEKTVATITAETVWNPGWDSIGLFLLCVGCLAGDWFIRRRQGLL